MKVILLGAPGSGKGTQSAYISESYSLSHISTGDIFRDNIKNSTPIGVKIKAIIDAGNLCPDDLTVEIVKDRLEKEDCKRGYLLDGFPRNLFQAGELDKFSAPDLVINLDVPVSLLQDRITGRRSCPKCKGSFHINFIGNTDICPNCGEKLITRADDNIESVKERLKVYNNQTAPLIDYYSKQGKLVNVDGSLEMNQVFEQIKKIINDFKLG